jgi:hypothetical protein
VRLAEGQTVHVAMGPDGRARTLPEELLEFIREGLAKV